MELRRRLPGIMDSYGGIDNFLTYVREFLRVPPGLREAGLADHTKAAFYNYIHTVITYSNDIIVTSPWALYLDLRDTLNNQLVNNDSINVDEPYRVYTLEGDLIYTVKSHFGVFGESKLDKQLIVNSSNASAYFLKFKTYSGLEKIKLLMVNMYTRNSQVSNQLLNKPPTVEASTISFVNSTGLPLTIYYVQSSILPNDLAFDFEQDQYRHIIAPNNIKVFNADKSGYFFFTGAPTVERTVITNPLNDLVFNTIRPELIFVGTNVDVTLLNKVFNKGIRYSNKPIQDVITLSP